MRGVDEVAQAWRHGGVLHRSNVSTMNGSFLSYGHVVGKTIGGARVARCCHYSVATASHCTAAKRVADRVQACPGHPGPRCKTCREFPCE